MTTSIDTIVLDTSAALKTPDIARLTTNALDGTGVFDVLMSVVKKHLIEEFENDRITGEEYTQVYLGALQSVMQSALQFLLNTQQEERIQAEIALTRQKTVTELAQTDDDIPVGLGFNGDSTIGGIVKLQKDKFVLDSNLVTSQIEHSEAQKDLIGQQIVSELSQTADTFTDALAAGYGFNTASTLAGTIKVNVDKVTMENALTEQRLVTELANTSDTKPVGLGKMSSTTAIAGLFTVQKNKAEAERVLLAQKANTELAQTADIVKTGAPYLNTVTAVTGVIGKQKTLYGAQTDGFARDAEQKLAKIVTDAWSVSATQGEATANTTNKLDDSSLGAIITKAKTGIGI